MVCRTLQNVVQVGLCHGLMYSGKLYILYIFHITVQIGLRFLNTLIVPNYREEVPTA